MYTTSNIRSITKGFTWRIVATLTTMAIVYIIFKRIDLAVIAGIAESVIKIGLYWGHERVWMKIRWGKKKIEPFSIWITGMPFSGKTQVANQVYEKLSKLHIPLERIDAKEIREIIPHIGYSQEERNTHLLRIGYLIKKLQNNSISTVSSFTSPFSTSRDKIGTMVEKHILIYIKTDTQESKQRAIQANAPEDVINDYNIYQEPHNADLAVDIDQLGIDEASNQVFNHIKKYF